jgi:electron transfer flavoprotein beta subunit
MNILVCISVVPDTTTKITFTDNNSQFNREGVQFIINPYDELALTRALEITEKSGGEVTVIHVGGVENEPSIRKALAIGAHKAIRINKNPNDAQEAASEIANYAKDKGYDMILTGRESIDYNSGQVCGLLGAMLSLPSINVVMGLDVVDGQAVLTRDIDGGRETISCGLPLVASAQKDLVEPRIPNMRGIMAARTKPLEVLEPTGESNFSAHQFYDLPEPKSAVKMISPDNAGELIRLLREEAKII